MKDKTIKGDLTILWWSYFVKEKDRKILRKFLTFEKKQCKIGEQSKLQIGV